MNMRVAMKQTAIDDAIEQGWYKYALGVQVNIMDIPKIFDEIKAELVTSDMGAMPEYYLSGQDNHLATIVKAVAAKYRVN